MGKNILDWIALILVIIGAHIVTIARCRVSVGVARSARTSTVRAVPHVAEIATRTIANVAANAIAARITTVENVAITLAMVAIVRPAQFWDMGITQTK